MRNKLCSLHKGKNAFSPIIWLN